MDSGRAELKLVLQMSLIFLVLCGTVSFLWLFLTPLKKKARGGKGAGKPATGRWLPSAEENPGKRDWEEFALGYSPLWISCFAAVVAFQLYKYFDALVYLLFCSLLCVPLLLHPIISPCAAEKSLPWLWRYGVKANVWLAVYSFIGNYWYTHYFYSVLKAKYTMPGWRLNDVPVQLYFATFFYFCTYHVLANLVLRKVDTSYKHNIMRTIFKTALIGAMSYFTAFTETLTISHYPDYLFEDRHMAYTVGSAFYGIYFIVSYPLFYRFDEWPQPGMRATVWDAVLDSSAAGMLILTLLDFVRLCLGISLTIKVSG